MGMSWAMAALLLPGSRGVFQGSRSFVLGSELASRLRLAVSRRFVGGTLRETSIAGVMFFGQRQSPPAAC